MISYKKSAFPVLHDLMKRFGIGDSTLKALAYASLKDTIICIDDFERRGKNLCPKNILGLISNLKEQNKCNIVLIFDDDKLLGKAKTDYEEYREKVIDQNVKFNPTPAECSYLVFYDADDLSLKLKGLCDKLKINNIRIIQKIENKALEIVALLKDKNLDDKVIDKALKSLTLFTWAYFAKGDEKAPDIEFIKKEYNSSDYYIKKHLSEKDKAANKGDDDKKNQHKLLKEYGYNETDQFALSIAEIVETGTVQRTV